MIAEIISIGDELLVGQVLNTNATWMAQQLHEIGIPVRQVSAIADDEEDIEKAFNLAFTRSDVILVTGGLGPTKDDITKHTLCKYFNSRLVFHQPSYNNIERLFGSRGYRIGEVNRRQAEVPEACIPLPNPHGTAPGMWFEKEGKVLVSMPGVPFEMEAIMENSVQSKSVGKVGYLYCSHHTSALCNDTVGVGTWHSIGNHRRVAPRRTREWYVVGRRGTCHGESCGSLAYSGIGSTLG